MKYLLQLFLVTFILPCALLQAATPDDQYITITLPEPVIQKSVKRILPLTFSVSTAQVEGIITIEKISDLQLKENHITAQLLLHGDNMTIKTMVADQEIRLQLGSASTDFACDAGLRYDAAEQILYIRPLPRELETEQSFKEGNIGEALLILLNGREFPLELHDIQPLIAETNNKTITIKTQIADIRSVPNSLQLRLASEISTNP